VKAPICTAVADPRFCGGHPMAGSEQEGLDGAVAGMFQGATWVLTPSDHTDDAAYAAVRAVAADLGADVVTLKPEHHDELVAVVSHVPHLTAATLMRLASGRADEHRALLRLAAGGFRDMTRIAAGHPGIWPDICAQNRRAILDVLDELIAGLGEVRNTVDATDRATLGALLDQARRARVNLPARAVRPEDLSEVRVPIADRKGELARVTTLAGELDVNVYDIEIAHSSEGDRGVLILLVDSALSERFVGGLLAVGYRPQVRALS
jgi:prephenate dehydrogenase